VTRLTATLAGSAHSTAALTTIFQLLASVLRAGFRSSSFLVDPEMTHSAGVDTGVSATSGPASGPASVSPGSPLTQAG